MILIDKLFIFLSKRLNRIPLRVKREFLLKEGLLSIGEYTYGVENIDFHFYKGSETKVEIGKFCSIGPDVRIILGGIHPVDCVSLYPFRIQFNLEGKELDGIPATKGPIIIGNDVWIGTGVTIMSGVKVGNGAILGGSSLITKDVASFSIVGGVPAKRIRNRFSEENCKKLEEIAWWEWPIEKLKEAIPKLSANNIDEFINKYSKT